MIFAANLKTNHTRSSFKIYSNELNKIAKYNENDIFVFPPSVAFNEDVLDFIQGAQNFYPCINGAYTGEIGKEQLDEFNIKAVLIGHSERRALGDNDELLKKKFDFAKENNYKIIFCIGEDKDTKQALKTNDFLSRQLEIIDLNYENLIIAYEPIYSIGTGISANLDDIEKTLLFLKTKTNAKLLYGGSVNEKNIKEILSINSCDGVLIGSAALNVLNFIKMIEG